MQWDFFFLKKKNTQWLLKTLLLSRVQQICCSHPVICLGHVPLQAVSLQWIRLCCCDIASTKACVSPDVPGRCRAQAMCTCREVGGRGQDNTDTAAFSYLTGLLFLQWGEQEKKSQYQIREAGLCLQEPLPGQVSLACDYGCTLPLRLQLPTLWLVSQGNKACRHGCESCLL